MKPAHEAPLKALIISHTYVARVNREKLAALAQQENLTLALLAPRHWRDTLGTVTFVRPAEAPYRVYTSGILFNGKGRLYVYHPWSLLAALVSFRPHIVHVEEEPDSLALLQLALLRSVFRFRLLFFTWENIFRRGLLNTVMALNLRACDGAIAGNSVAQELLLRRGFHKPVIVLPQLGIDPTQFKREPNLPLRTRLGLGGFTIGYLGRLVEEKGLLTLVEAVARLEGDHHLLLVGRGPLRERLMRRAAELGLADRMVIIDPIPHDEVPAYLNCMDVLVLPSLTTPRWQEQFGHVLIEAMACQVPVVGSDSGAIPEVIGDAGLIFPEGSVKDLRAKLSLLASNPALKEEWGNKGRRRVLENFTHQRIAAATAHFYRGIVGS